MGTQQTKDTYEFTHEEFVRRLERSVQSELGMDLDAFLEKYSNFDGEPLSFTETHLVRAARLAGLLKPYSLGLYWSITIGRDYPPKDSPITSATS
jgi:hypothetical protein